MFTGEPVCNLYIIDSGYIQFNMSSSITTVYIQIC